MRQIRSGLRTIAMVVVTTVAGISHSVDSVSIAAVQVPQISAVQKIWSQPTHQSFFTDLIRFRGAWICCFREAATHGSVDGYIRLIRSSDGQRWVAASRIDCPPPNQDLRDPKLSITPERNITAARMSGFLMTPSTWVRRHRSVPPVSGYGAPCGMTPPTILVGVKKHAGTCSSTAVRMASIFGRMERASLTTCMSTKRLRYF